MDAINAYFESLASILPWIGVIGLVVFFAYFWRE